MDKMRILVVEDDKCNVEVAKEALGGSHELTIATNYEEAMSLLVGKITFDVVLTDLFFPESETEAVGPKGHGLIDLLKAHKEAPKPTTSGFIFSAPRPEPQFEDEYAPMGLKIFAEAARRKTPCLIVSNGNRHHGSLGSVRNATGMMLGNDPLPSTMYGRGCCGEYTKSRQQVWQQAVETALEEKFDASHVFAKNF